jgi:hypothetical protein
MEVTESDNALTKLAGQRFPQRREFQGQRYGAGIKLPDLPAELANAGGCIAHVRFRG